MINQICWMLPRKKKRRMNWSISWNGDGNFFLILTQPTNPVKICIWCHCFWWIWKRAWQSGQLNERTLWDMVSWSLTLMLSLCQKRQEHADECTETNLTMRSQMQKTNKKTKLRFYSILFYTHHSFISNLKLSLKSLNIEMNILLVNFTCLLISLGFMLRLKYLISF